MKNNLLTEPLKISLTTIQRGIINQVKRENEFITDQDVWVMGLLLLEYINKKHCSDCLDSKYVNDDNSIESIYLDLTEAQYDILSNLRKSGSFEGEKDEFILTYGLYLLDSLNPKARFVDFNEEGKEKFCHCLHADECTGDFSELLNALRILDRIRNKRKYFEKKLTENRYDAVNPYEQFYNDLLEENRKLEGKSNEEVEKRLSKLLER